MTGGGEGALLVAWAIVLIVMWAAIYGTLRGLLWLLFEYGRGDKDGGG